MTQQTIGVGTSPNDGQGNPIRTAFIKCNDNFDQLFARAQVDPPPTLVGSIGDQAGWYAYDSSYFYYCFANYDGSSVIWAQISQIGNVTVNTIASGTSNIRIVDINGNATTSIAGTSNVVVVASTGQYIAGIVSATGNITGSYLLGNGSQLTGLPATYTNSNVTALLAAFGGNTFSSTGIVSTTGNVTGANVNGGNILGNSISSTGNISSASQISATGNITTTGYFVGNFIGNVVATISNVPGPNGAVLYNDGTGNVAATSGLVFDNAGPNTLTVLGSYSATGNILSTGYISTSSYVTATGNITGANIYTGGVVSAAGNVRGGNLNTAGLVTATGNVTGGNITTAGLITATGNVTGGNLITTGTVSATGNIRGGNLAIITDIAVGGNVSTTNLTGTGVSVVGNISGGNIKTVGLVSATGNVTGNYLFGNGSQLTGLVPLDSIQYGNSNVLVGSTGNVSVNINGVTPVVLFNQYGQFTYGNITASGFVSAGNLISEGTVSAVGNIIGANFTTIGLVSSTGNVTGGNLLTGGAVSATANIDGGANLSISGYANISGNINGSSNVVASVAVYTPVILHTGSNATGNIGSVDNGFNYVYATTFSGVSTTAKYADLAECYLADAQYEPGTVLSFGGPAELTVSAIDLDVTVAGVVSTNPAYQMNTGLQGENIVALALTGRVPCLVQGVVKRGDMMVSAGNGRARAEKNPAFGSVIGKALESFDGDTGTIEVVVGRL